MAAHPTQKNDFDKVIALDTTWLVQVLFEGVLDGIDPSLSAHLILVGGTVLQFHATKALVPIYGRGDGGTTKTGRPLSNKAASSVPIREPFGF